MILAPARVSTDKFSYRNGVFVAELSDLGPDFRLGQVYDDAADVGLTLVSAKTGAEVVFAVDEEVRDREGELQIIHLRPAGVCKRELAHLRITLFND